MKWETNLLKISWIFKGKKKNLKMFGKEKKNKDKSHHQWSYHSVNGRIEYVTSTFLDRTFSIYLTILQEKVRIMSCARHNYKNATPISIKEKENLKKQRCFDNELI